MFEPRLLTEEEAQWRASCGWHVDESAVDFSLLRNLGLTVVVSVGAANENEHGHERGDCNSGTDA